MNKTSFFRKAVTWLLISLMANPAAIAPAFARDTDIYLNTNSGAATAEPNIMIVLDTSDSMNYFEDWTEYPGAYDSHVEYLWNDPIIGFGATPQNAESGSYIATGIGPTVTSIVRAGTTATVTFASAHGYAAGWTVNVYNATDPLYNGSFPIVSVPTSTTITYTMSGTPAANAVATSGYLLYASSRNKYASSVYGFWAGSTPEARLALWASAKATALAIEPAGGNNDPGPRYIHRDYNDGSWLYFTTISSIYSPRLRATSFDRFRGHVQSIAGTRGGVTFSAANDYRTYNRCNDSGNDPTLPANTNATGLSSQVDPSDGVTPQGLTPSTIFAPTAAPRNSGRYLNQKWVRWERFLNLQNGRFTSGDTTYGTTASSAGFSSSNVGPYTIAPASSPSSGVGNAGSSISLRTDHAVAPINASAVRDSYPNSPGYGNNTTNIGQQGQPIRTRIDKGTVGTVQSGDSYAGWTTPKADLGGFGFLSAVISAPYTWNEPASYASLAAGSYQVLRDILSFYSINAGSAAAAPAMAWFGNRDNPPGPDDSYTTGTPAYYDHAGTLANKQSATTFNMTAANTNGASSFAAGNIINVSDYVQYVVAQIATITTSGGNPLVTLCTANGVPNANCTMGVYTNLSTLGANLAVSLNLKLITSSTVVTQNICSRTCTLDADGGVAGVQAAIKESKFTDGAGQTLYYFKTAAGSAATCVSTAVTPGPAANGTTDCVTTNLPAACTAPAGSGNVFYTAVFGGCAWTGRQSLYVEGAGTYYYGGVCGAAATCTHPTGANVDASTCPASNILSTNTYGSSSYQVSNYCSTSGLANISVNGNQLAGSVLGSATSGCSNAANQSQACTTRPGAPANPACTYISNGVPSATAGCTQPSPTTSTTGSPSFTDYAVFNYAAADTNLYHDCLADNGTNGNPSNGYITNGNPSNGYYTPFGTSWGASYSAAAGSNVPYTDSGHASNGGLNINVYSVNYLNWVFGPKGPSGAPIGRKTRLQIAKDALSSIIASTNGVRMGLMAFNNTAACASSVGTITPGTAVFTGLNSGFTNGQSVSLPGAGAAGAALTTTISATAPNAIDPNSTDFTLATNATNPSTTGSIANGSGTVTVASSAGFAVGQRVSVSGADPTNAPSNALVSYITGILASPARLVLTDTANATVAGASVTLAPILTTMAANPCSGATIDDGANVQRVITRMGSSTSDLPAYNNRATLIAALNSLTASSRTPLTESLYEAYRYFSGRSPKWGTSTATTSTAVSVTTGRDTTAICTTTGPGTGCTATGNYASPMLNNPNTTSPAGCQKNFQILITDGGPEDDYSANADIKSLSWAGPLGVVAPRTTLDANNAHTATGQFEVTPGVPFGPTDLAGTTYDGGYIWLDELTYFMANADISPGARNFPSDSTADTITGRQSVNTYTIGFAGANTPVLQNAALRGNGVDYSATNSSGLAASIIAALAAITNWNPTIAAPTVPISALNRTQNATDVYLAFFQPTPNMAWLGTVKKYELSQYPNNGDATICGSGIGLCLIGQTQLTKTSPNPPLTWNIETVQTDPITGISQSVVDPNAVSYWQPTSVTDGSSPVNGGTGYQLINNLGTVTPDTRNVYTFLTNAVAQQNGNSGSSILLTNAANKVHFSNAGNISKCRLGDAAACSGTATMSDATQETLINYLRGGDVTSNNNCSDGFSTTCLTWRSWAHADVQHSTPSVVSYTSSAPVIQRMYYLQNNGLLTSIDTSTGLEKWSFMVEEALPQIQTLLNNTAGAEDYVADGTPSVYIVDVNGDGNIVQSSGDKVWLYFGLRRGGRAYYAIDVTNPDAPVFGWKIDASQTPAKVCVGNGVCTSAPQFNQIGQTWSTPYIGKVRANANPVMIFGGGYDPADDSIPVGTRTMGRAVYVIDAYNTTLVQSWGVGQSGPFLGSGASSMIYAIPSAVTSLNTDLDAQNLLDRLYVGDTYGNLWRMDIDDTNVTNWNAKLLASLSSDISSGERRKILFPPAAVRQNSPYRFDAVYVGTGDLEHPLCLSYNQVTPTVMTNTCSAFAPANNFYMVVDTDTGLVASNTSPILTTNLYARPTTDIATNTSNTILNTNKGWYRAYDNGEKSSNAPTVFNNQLTFGTYAPLGQSGGACVPPGEGRLNEINAITGDYLPINGSVSQPSDRYLSTFITHGYISTGQLIVEGKSIYQIVVSDARLQSNLVGSMGSATKIYWYMEPEQ